MNARARRLRGPWPRALLVLLATFALVPEIRFEPADLFALLGNLANERRKPLIHYCR